MITEEKETLLRRFKFLIAVKKIYKIEIYKFTFKKMKVRRELELPNIFSDPRAMMYKPHVYTASIIILQITIWN